MVAVCRAGCPFPFRSPSMTRSLLALALLACLVALAGLMTLGKETPASPQPAQEKKTATKTVSPRAKPTAMLGEEIDMKAYQQPLLLKEFLSHVQDQMADRKL